MATIEFGGYFNSICFTEIQRSAEKFQVSTILNVSTYTVYFLKCKRDKAYARLKIKRKYGRRSRSPMTEIAVLIHRISGDHHFPHTSEIDNTH